MSPLISSRACSSFTPVFGFSAFGASEMTCPPLNLRICRMYGHRIRVSPLCNFSLPHFFVPATAPERCAYPFGVGSNGLIGGAHFLLQPFGRTAERLHIAEKLAFQILRHSLKFMPRHRPRDIIAFHFSVFLLPLLFGEGVAGERTPTAFSVDVSKCTHRYAFFLHAVVIKIIHSRLCTPPCVDSACHTAPCSRHG